MTFKSLIANYDAKLSLDGSIYNNIGVFYNLSGKDFYFLVVVGLDYNGIEIAQKAKDIEFTTYDEVTKSDIWLLAKCPKVIEIDEGLFPTITYKVDGIEVSV